MNDIYKNSILIIGPSYIDKVKIANILRDKSNLPLVDLDEYRTEYYREKGYDKEYANRLKLENGTIAKYKYAKPFEAYFISSFLDGLTEDSIIKFNAYQTVYEDPELFKLVYNTINKFENVILILPDIDLHESWKKVNKLAKVPAGSDLSKLNWHLISSPCNNNLATYTTCVSDRTYEEVTDEIIDYINSKKVKLCV